MVRVARLLVGAALAVAPARPASAEGPPDVRAAAEKLYQDAYALALEGYHARACEMYEESDRLDPANGTKLELARCYEKTDRPASAWALYVAVAEADKVSGKNRAREAEARARAEALEAELPKLVLMVPSSVADRTGLTITRDGVPIGEALWGTPMPVDLGRHTIRAFRPDQQAWEGIVNVSKNGETILVAIPAPAAWAPRGRDVPRGQDGRRGMGPPPAVALALGGVALAGFSVGGACGGLAFTKWQEALDMAPRQCSAPAGLSGCTQAVADKGAEASRFAAASTAGFVVGGAALAAGAIVWLVSAPGKRPAASGRLQILPSAGPGIVGGIVRGEF
ncbi:hypothetical protein [Polyangium sp. 6x1]|uniref:hypothetical protein n=1 Tax=Polyangium sp. 6x1 TaxID=3042689 RepID=UPI0024826378|nr:hypothetical protein [Polyangium sp. 6x1]MDI1446955.1 hypothetical protein [Polyangium sp. 6x1]